jgi:hypothetical protein
MITAAFGAIIAIQGLHMDEVNSVAPLLRRRRWHGGRTNAPTIGVFFFFVCGKGHCG